MEPFEKTYAMIKPDAVRAGKAEEICQLIEVHGFTITAKKKLQASTSIHHVRVAQLPLIASTLTRHVLLLDNELSCQCLCLQKLEVLGLSYVAKPLMLLWNMPFTQLIVRLCFCSLLHSEHRSSTVNIKGSLSLTHW